MTDMNKINVAALENVAGGKYENRTVHNDAVNYANIRKEPGLSSEVFFTAKNGQEVTITGNKVKKDGYVWYEVMLAGAYDTGWIAGSLIGF